MQPAYVELIGLVAAVVTTLCWLPQTLKMLKEKRSEGVSLVTNLALALGMLLWLTYGVLLASWPLILSNVVSLAMIAAIITLKLRYG